jgi:hypothetical protein
VTQELRLRVEAGRKLFEQELVTGIGDREVPQSKSCAECHRPSLKTIGSQLVVRDPQNEAEGIAAKTGLSSKRRSSADLPILQRFGKAGVIERLQTDNESGRLRAARGTDSESSRLRKAVELSALRVDGTPDGYQYDLSLKHTVSLPLSYPRLPEDDNGDIVVPLFSDLKRHKMGVGLKDIAPQEVDVQGIFVPEEEFLTRPLWGVADTGPWLHDGRARTLRQAILLHGSAGSEAEELVRAFQALEPDDQQKIVEFLLTLRLPVDERYHLTQKR